MGNDVRVTIDVDYKGQGGVAAANRDIRNLTRDAENAGKAFKAMDSGMKGADDSARKLARAQSDAAGKIKNAADATTKLAAETKVASKALDTGAENAREGARAYDKLAEKIREVARASARLLLPTGKKGEIGGSLFSGIGKIATGIGKIATGLAGNGLSGGTAAINGLVGTPVVGPALLAGGAVAATGASFFAGGAAGGAGALGAGVGAAGAGLAGAWMSDPKYAEEANRSLDKLQARFRQAGRGFTDELSAGLKIVDQQMEQLPIEKLIAAGHGVAAPLLQGSGQGINAAVDGLAELAAKGQEIAKTVGPELADFGHDVGDAFRAIGMGSEDGAQALGDFINLAGYAVKSLGILILGFEQGYGNLRDFATGVHGVAEEIPGLGGVMHDVEDALFGVSSSLIVTARTLDDTGDSTSNWASNLVDAARAGAEASIAANELNDSLAKLHNQQLSMADANIAVAQGWIDLKKELQEGAKTLDLNTQAGVDNQKQIVGQIENLERLRLQAIETGGGTVEATNAANEAYARQVEQVRQAAYAAGFNKTEVDKLITSLYSVPPKVSSDVQVTGLSTALDQGISLGNALNNLNGRTYSAKVSVTSAISGVTAGLLGVAGISPGSAGMGNKPGRATGGPGSGMTLVGEHGPELVDLGAGGSVYSNANSRQMMGQGGGGAGGGGRMVVELNITGSGPGYDFFMAAQRSGDVQILSSAIVSDN